MRLFYEGLSTCNFRRWEVPQFKQWSKTIGHTSKVGIELEINAFEVLSPTRKEWLLSQDILFSWQRDGKIEYEVQILFDVSSPIELMKQINKFVSAMRRCNLPTLGAVHVNVQVPKGNYNLNRGNSEGEIIGDNIMYKRKEFKTGSGFLKSEELFWQICFFVPFCYGMKKEDILIPCLVDKYPTMKDIVYKSYNRYS